MKKSKKPNPELSGILDRDKKKPAAPESKPVAKKKQADHKLSFTTSKMGRTI